MASFHKVIKAFKVYICSEFALFSMGSAIKRAHSTFERANSALEGAHSEGKLICLLSRLHLPLETMQFRCRYELNSFITL